MVVRAHHAARESEAHAHADRIKEAGTAGKASQANNGGSANYGGSGGSANYVDNEGEDGKEAAGGAVRYCGAPERRVPGLASTSCH
ncbi:hypothetical protein JCM10599A_22380 [Paraburkholderia kururiensis]